MGGENPRVKEYWGKSVWFGGFRSESDIPDKYIPHRKTAGHFLP